MSFLSALLERENTGRTIVFPEHSCSQTTFSSERDIQRELVKRAWDNLQGFDLDTITQNTQEWTSLEPEPLVLSAPGLYQTADRITPPYIIREDHGVYPPGVPPKAQAHGGADQKRSIFSKKPKSPLFASKSKKKIKNPL